MLKDFLHIVNLRIALVLDTIVLHVDHADIYKDSILVISSNWKLGNLNLTLFHVYNNLEIKFKLFLTVN